MNEVGFCLDKCLKFNPKHSFAYSNKGDSFNNLGLYQEAIACYDQCLEFDPNNTNA